MDDEKMIYGSVYADGHSNNSLFATEDSVHRYNPTHTPRLLRQAFLEQGVEINTPDVNQGKEVAFELHLEGRPLGEKSVPRYLIALENPNINKLNASAEYCHQFELVFAWDVRLFHLPNVMPVLIPHPLVHGEFPGLAERDIFSCLINANKAFKEMLPTDLYLERINTIRWYERHAPDKFELYGMGWEKPMPAFNAFGRIKRSVSKLEARLFGLAPFPSHRGEVGDKAAVLRRAKFSYCYENSRDLSNYITEKIFDSLVSGCVPVYWGADNVLDCIPENCFIDRRKFKDTAAVHKYLCSISATEYETYQSNIVKFLESDMARQFSSEYFASVIVEHVCRDIKGTRLAQDSYRENGTIQ